MQIIIPMSGIGQRFLDSGYLNPKPLIKVDGKPMIEHVVHLFPGEKNFIFVCNEEHLRTTDLKSILNRIAPEGKIFSIPVHKKGPVFAVKAVEEMILDEEEVIVNYCDFSKKWDYCDFLKNVRFREADGAITAYRGFHPHMLASPNYAFIKESSEWLIEIREKQSFVRNKMNQYASDGTYYFKYGKFVKKYFQRLMERNIHTNGEYYVSMVYNLMRQDGLKIAIYEIERMLQWGTPEDLREYQQYSDYFKKRLLIQKNIKPLKKSLTVVLLAGHGKRFVDAGHACPKPLISIENRPMVMQAVKCLPRTEKYIFSCLSKHINCFPLVQEIRKEYPSAKIVKFDRVTEGQACTCELALRSENLGSPLLVASCDNGLLWDRDRFLRLVKDQSVDAVVWTFRHRSFVQRNPDMYGWVKVDSKGCVRGVSVKKSISSDPFNDHVIMGIFYFKKTKYFLEAASKMHKKNTRVNNEFYIDSCIGELLDDGRKVKIFEIKDFVGWGTPDDLKTYEYWQEFFDQHS
jgi:NDP-sugar pyrophosphorylase family protein